MREYTQYDDVHLLSLLRQGDESAFNVIYKRYWEKLFYKAEKKLHNHYESENIVQDILADLWQRRSMLEVTGTLNHYLAVALKYQIIKHQRRESKKEARQGLLTEQTTSTGRTTEEYLAYSELNRRMAKLVANLPEKCQLIFRLREGGLSQQEIANEMGVSENTVETHIKNALKTLRKGLAHFFLLLH